MARRSFALSAIVVCVVSLSACAEDTSLFEGDGGSGGSGQGGSNQGGAAAAGGSMANGGAGAAGGASATTGSSSGGSASVYDPNLDGPYGYAEIDDSVTVPATNNNVAIHCAYPTGGPDSGPYPVVVMGHGFQLPPSQYYSYVRRLASFGYVALTVDFQAGFTGTHHVNNAHELLAGLDWAESNATVGGIADGNNAGASGHSLGGKLALLAASLDGRIKAAITLDPVDGAMNCSAQNCPDVSDLLPLGIPTGFIGETTDSMGFQACAPAADNYTTFYANAGAPSLSVTALGANHMSFIDDLASCGLACILCKAAPGDPAAAAAMSRAYVAAFYERHLKGNSGYDDYLIGAEAQVRYVDTGLAVIDAK